MTWLLSICWAKRKSCACPGLSFEMPGYFRISLTANDEMVEARPARFRARLRESQGRLIPG